MSRLSIVKVIGEREVNSYVVSCSDTKEAVIIDPAEPAAKIGDQLRGMKPRWIVATHGHPGHVAGKDELKAATGAETAMNVADAKAFLRSADRYVTEDDELEFGRFKLRIIFTPGHTPGSLCFLVGNHLFTGDTLLAGGIGKELPGSDVRQQLISIGTKLARLPLNTAIYPGHGPVTKLETELRTSPVFEALRR